MIRRNITVLGCALMLMFMFAGTKAHADRVHFHSNGGAFSHSYHSGWNRYWGGPSIGFYYAPSPVYVVSGYGDPSYYEGSDFWYSNPAFGLSINIGGADGGCTAAADTTPRRWWRWSLQRRWARWYEAWWWTWRRPRWWTSPLRQSAVLLCKIWASDPLLNSLSLDAADVPLHTTNRMPAQGLIPSRPHLPFLASQL